MKDNDTPKRPVVSRDFLIGIFTLLIAASFVIFAVKLKVSQIPQATAWHRQNNHRLRMRSYDFDLPSGWFPIHREKQYISLTRASFFDSLSQRVTIYELEPGTGPDITDTANAENKSNAPWVRSPVLWLRGKPGSCIVHYLSEAASGHCIFDEAGLWVVLSNLDKSRLKEVAGFFNSSIEHPRRISRLP